MECFNGGTLALGGAECFCPEQYFGNQCERLHCLNGGTSLPNTTTMINTVRRNHDHQNEIDRNSGKGIVDVSEYCQCPDELHFNGTFCQQVFCENDGRPLWQQTEDDIIGHHYRQFDRCDCLTYHFRGTFCERPNKIILKTGLLLMPMLILLLISCYVCRSHRFSSDAKIDDGRHRLTMLNEEADILTRSHMSLNINIGSLMSLHKTGGGGGGTGGGGGRNHRSHTFSFAAFPSHSTSAGAHTHHNHYHSSLTIPTAKY